MRRTEERSYILIGNDEKRKIRDGKAPLRTRVFDKTKPGAKLLTICMLPCRAVYKIQSVCINLATLTWIVTLKVGLGIPSSRLQRLSAGRHLPSPPQPGTAHTPALCTMPRGQSSGHHALAHLLAAHSNATPKQAKEPIFLRTPIKHKISVNVIVRIVKGMGNPYF